MERNEIIAHFHMLWDNFPGMARLIDSDHNILAANKAAEDKGFCAGQKCCSVGAAAAHKGCLKTEMHRTGRAQTDMPMPDRIRGWLPVAGHEDLFVHFTLMVPENN